jgi:DNA ligase-associated metallophosphoesterase
MLTDPLHGSCEVVVAGERVVLLPGRALWWPRQRTVFVADLHWGKAAAFRAANVPVPTGTTGADLDRLSFLLQRTDATRLVVLGDLLHAKHGRHEDTFAQISRWRSAHEAMTITLIRGNHDAHAGDPPASLNIVCVDDPQPIGPFVLRHDPVAHDGGYVLAGHLHPHATIGGRGRQRLRLPCFVLGPRVGILPAFTAFSGKGMYVARDTDALYAIADDEVIALASS